MQNSLVGIGLYSIPEAARLARASRTDVARWMFGHDYKAHGERRHADPVAGEQLKVDDVKTLNFYDLLEVRLVRELRESGVSLQAIRKAALNAKQLFNSTHPFVLRRIQTDGRNIFAQAANDTGDDKLLDLVRKKYAFKKILETSLVKGVEFSNDVASRWYPVPNSRAVVLDPLRNFGKPTIAKCGVPTWTLYQAFLAEDRDRDRTARIYDVTSRAVDHAVRFESDLVH